jgi:hypothetical protein
MKQDTKPTTKDSDQLNPIHYKSHPSGVECIDITEHMPFLEGNAIKYIWRAKHKGREKQDLLKAIWYLQRRIKRIDAEEVNLMRKTKPFDAE